jgi:predicted RNA-binding protein
MAKYKVGDKVRVRSDLKDDGDRYYMEDKSEWWYFYENMQEFLGEVVTIANFDEGDNAYEIEEDDGEDYWADEMFEGLAEETPKTFKVGDRVIASDNLNIHKDQPGTIVRVDLDRDYKYCVKFDARPGSRLWSDVTSLIEEKEPEPIQVNVNINININYDNACWYCRKGGLVDLYFDGQPYICPHCGRVCNSTEQMTKSHTPDKPAKKESKPLTTEELKALPDGTKVFTVWINNGKPQLTDDYTCWRTKKGTRLNRKHGTQDFTLGNGEDYYVYLEMPEGAVDSGK